MLWLGVNYYGNHYIKFKLFFIFILFLRVAMSGFRCLHVVMHNGCSGFTKQSRLTEKARWPHQTLRLHWADFFCKGKWRWHCGSVSSAPWVPRDTLSFWSAVLPHPQELSRPALDLPCGTLSCWGPLSSARPWCSESVVLIHFAKGSGFPLIRRKNLLKGHISRASTGSLAYVLANLTALRWVQEA